VSNKLNRYEILTKEDEEESDGKEIDDYYSDKSTEDDGEEDKMNKTEGGSLKEKNNTEKIENDMENEVTKTV